MNKATIAAIALASLPVAAQAHPGHFGLDQGVMHVLTNADHLIGAAIWLSIAALAVYGVVRRERANE